MPFEDLDARERELLKELEAVREAKKKQRLEEEQLRREEQRRLELEKPVVVAVTGLAGGSIIIMKDWRPDVDEFFRVIPGRIYRGGETMVPISEWQKVEPKLLELPKVTVKYKAGVQDEIDWYLSAPPFLVDIHKDKELKITPGPNPPATALRSISGCAFNWEHKDYTVPLSEGHKVFEVLSKIEGVVYTEEAQKRIMELVERRLAVDKIAKMEKLEEAFEVPFPPDRKLHPFQEVGVKFTEASGGKVILSDDPGLGKTWQFLAFAQRQHHLNGGCKSLVICKAGLIDKWWREIKDLTGESAFICKGTKPGVYEVEKLLVEGPRFAIISYTTLGHREVVEKKTGEFNIDGEPEVEKKDVFRWPAILKRAEFDLVGVDESQYIKTPDAYRTKAAHMLVGHYKWLMHLTATPILNRPGELWSLLYMVAPEIFPLHGTFVWQYATPDGRRAMNVEHLREMLKPFMLRRSRHDVLKDLPFINRITEVHSLSERAQKLYNQVLAGIWEELAEFDASGNQGGFRTVRSILAQITRLKQICAIDKAEHTADLATELIDSQEEESTKKVLIFTHFKAAAVNIAQRLGSQAVCTVKRTRSGFNSMTPGERDQLFEEVRRREDVKFVVTTEAAKEGHNLDYCWWTIFNDLFWTPASHEQCEGRAYGRLIDPHEIDSYYMVATDPAYPIEEWLMEILKSKMRVFEEVVNGVEQARDTDESVVSELIARMRKEMWKRAP